MKKSILFILLLFVLTSNLFSQQDFQGDVYFFIIDLSESMEWNNLTDKVITEVENYIENEVHLNDRLVMMGFGHQNIYIYDDILKSEDDKKVVMHNLESLEFKHQYTHMTVAFESLRKRLEELHEFFPKANKYIFIFTDGKNNPPDYANEPPQKFLFVLTTYFSENNLKPINSFIYYISLGIEAPPEVVEVAKDNSRIGITENIKVQEDEPIIPLSVKLELKEKKYNLLQKKKETLKLKFDVISITKATTLVADFQSQIETVDLIKKTKKFQINFKPQDLSIGEYEANIKFSLKEDGSVEPQIFKIYYIVAKPDYTIWYILIALAVLIILIIIINRIRPVFTGKLKLRKEGVDIIKTLRGKNAIKLQKLQRGWGFSPSVKLHPASSVHKIKVTFSNADKKNIKVNGRAVDKNSIELRQNNGFEYRDVIITYVK